MKTIDRVYVTLAAEIQAIEPEWTVTASEEFEQNISIKLPNGGELYLLTNVYNHPGRVTIGCNYPRQNGSAYYYGKRHTPSISVALSRGAGAIVKEIRRRLLPDYEVTYAAALKEQRTYEEYTAQKLTVTRRLASILGTEPRNEERAYYYHDGLTADVQYASPTSVTMKLTLPPALAESVLKLIMLKDGEE